MAEPTILAALARRFQSQTSLAPRIFRAPGRVNLIGEHTDYNNGFVLPAALGEATWVAAAARDDRRVIVRSEAMGQVVEFDLDARSAPGGEWIDYVAGVAYALEDDGHRLHGAELLIFSTVPRGAGLSSSAALEVASALAMTAVSGVRLAPEAMARLCQVAENTFVGARCGLMDQFTSTHARAGHALLLDCRSLDHSHVAMPAAARLVVAHTGVKHRIAQGEYNARRSECEEAASLLGVPSLREATDRHVARAAESMPVALRRRVRHVLSENQRVVDTAAALGSGNLAAAGRLMTESHVSLRDDFQVSCRELDLMVDLALARPGVFGARLTGGGFGGCTVTLVDAGAAQAVAAELRTRYGDATGISPDIWIAEPSAAAEEVTPR